MKIKEAIEAFPLHVFVTKHPSDTTELEQADNERCAKSIVDMVIEPLKTIPKDQPQNQR